MGRRATLDDEELLDRLGRVFREVGYAGASLTALSEATGLKKASLYHRFPGGKEQMAREVLEHAARWLEEEVLIPLRGDGEPRARLVAMARKLDSFYSGGKQACLLNMMSSAHIHEGPFVQPIKRVFRAWIDALAGVAREAGYDRGTAKARAERAVIHLQGALVLSRGTGTTRPFKELLKSLPDDLLE